jgi:hypothetical protein
MLQNRVDPQGAIIKTNARGSWMGNRGQLHNDFRQIIRPFKLKAWLICVLEFKGIRRKIMAPHRYTELFFLDEATAFAAGHRPCFECRRKDANRFKTFWLMGNPEYGFNGRTTIREIDKILHSERVDRFGTKITYQDIPATLPDGTFILWNCRPYLVKNHHLLIWSPEGYGQAILFPNIEFVEVLTPRSIVNTIKAGYKLLL